MQVLVTFRHVEPTNALREYAEQKVRRVQKFLKRPSDAHVVLSVVKRRHIAEVTLQAPRSTLTATEETGDLYSAIDLAMDKIERQARKLVTKRNSRKHQGRAGETGEEIRVDTPSGDVVWTERVAIKPMSIDEAVMQMKLLKNEFLLFQNAANEMLSVVYRRKDGQFGLIEPEVS